MSPAVSKSDPANPTIADVESFWNAHPLCAFESPYPVGSKEFFDWHHQVRQADEGQYAGHLYEFDKHKGERVHFAYGRVPGRTEFAKVKSVEDFARLFDGNDNPIGKIYTTREFKALFPAFTIERIEIHYFPQRFLSATQNLPAPLRRAVDRYLGLMIYAQLRKER